MAIPKLIYRSDNSYVIDQGVLLEGFEDAAEWYEVGGVGASIENDSTNRRQGSQSIKLNAVNGAAGWASKIVDWDLSSMDNIIFWVYISDYRKLDYIQLTLANVRWSKYYYITLTYATAGEFNIDHFKDGWNKFVIPKSAFSETGSPDWNDSIVGIQIKCKAATAGGEDVSVSWDDLRMNYVAKAKCILTFDDGFETVYTNAKPIMDGNGQTGTAFIISGYVGGSIEGDNCMSKAQLEGLRDAGWDVSNHTDGLGNLFYMSQEDMEAAIDNGYDWLVSNGFEASAKFFCYPSGAFKDTVITKLRERHVLARTTIDTEYDPHFRLEDDDIDMLMKKKGVGSDQTPATVKGWIDKIIETNGLLVLMFHRIVDSGASGGCEYNKADFEEISDYLASSGISGDIDVITFGDYYAQFESTTVYLKHGPLIPYRITHEPSESVNRTEDRQLKVYSHSLAGNKKRVWRVKCIADDSANSDYKWEDLEYFYWQVVKGAKHRCIFVDANSVQYLVRIIGFAPKAIGLNNRHEVTMILEEDYT